MSRDVNVPPVSENSIALITDLTREFASTDSQDRWGVYCGVDDNGPLSAVATWIERRVFQEMYGVDEETVAAEFTPYMDQTIWSVVVHHPTNMAVGATRCLVGPARQLLAAHQFSDGWDMSWDDGCARVGADPDGSFLEAASLSVLPEWRSANRMWPVKALTSSYMHLFEDLQADWAVQIINPRAKRLFEGWGTPFVTMGGPRNLNGVPFIPALIPRIPGRPFFKTKDDEYYDLMQNRDGRGRGGTRLPPLDLDKRPLVVRLDDQLRTDRSDRLNPSPATDG